MPVTSTLDFPGQVKDGSVGSDLNPLEKGRAVMAVANNVAKLAKAPGMLEETLRMVEDITKSLLQCIEMILSDQSTMDGIKAVGKKAHAANCFKPADLVGGFWPDQSRVLPPRPPKAH